MPTIGTSAGDLIRSVGLLPDGPVLLGRPIGVAAGGVYVLELAAPLNSAPVDIARIGKWIERVEGLRLNGERPTAKALASRMALFWLPSQTVVFVGAATGSLGGRLRALEQHILGDPRPHAAAQWLKALRLDALRVYWAGTDAPEEYEDGILETFAARVSPEERANLPDRDTILPFANLRRPTGDRKKTGLTGATIPVEKAPEPPAGYVVDLAPGTADGVASARNAGTTRRTNAVPPRARATPAPRKPVVRLPRGSRPKAEAVPMTADGLDRLKAELVDLTTVQRPGVIERIVRARELGDLKENSDYTSARDEQSFLEGRVQAIEERLRNAVVLESPAESQRVTLGSRVTTELQGDEMTFEIVGTSEADPTNGRISNASPVGRALIGRRAGEEAIVQTPRGEVRYKVLSID